LLLDLILGKVSTLRRASVTRWIYGLDSLDLGATVAEILVGPVKILTNDQGWQADRRSPIKRKEGQIGSEVEGEIRFAVILAGRDSITTEIFMHDDWE